MISKLCVAAALLAGLVLQTTFFPKFLTFLGGAFGISTLCGRTVDLTLLGLIYLALNRDWTGVCIWSVLVGMATTWFGLAWRGAEAASFFWTAMVCLAFSRNVLLKSASSVMAATFGLSLLEGVLHLVAGKMFHRIPDPFQGQGGGLLLQAVLNALVSPLVYFGLAKLDSFTRTHASPSRSVLLPGFEA